MSNFGNLSGPPIEGAFRTLFRGRRHAYKYSDLMVPLSEHGSVIDVGRAHYEGTVIHDHSLWMDVYHLGARSVISGRQCVSPQTEEPYILCRVRHPIVLQRFYQWVVSLHHRMMLVVNLRSQYRRSRVWYVSGKCGKERHKYHHIEDLSCLMSGLDPLPQGQPYPIFYG